MSGELKELMLSVVISIEVIKPIEKELAATMALRFAEYSYHVLSSRANSNEYRSNVISLRQLAAQAKQYRKDRGWL